MSVFYSVIEVPMSFTLLFILASSSSVTWGHSQNLAPLARRNTGATPQACQWVDCVNNILTCKDMHESDGVVDSACVSSGEAAHHHHAACRNLHDPSTGPISAQVSGDLSEICVSHSGEYVDTVPLGSDVMWFCRWLPTLRRVVSPVFRVDCMASQLRRL
jgi:hypothetical protein